MCPHLVFSKIFHLFVQFRPNAHKNNVPWILHPFRGPPQNIKLTWYRMFHHVTAFYTHARTHTHTHTPWSHTHTHSLSLSLPPPLSLSGPKPLHMQNETTCKVMGAKRGLCLEDKHLRTNIKTLQWISVWSKNGIMHWWTASQVICHYTNLSTWDGLLNALFLCT